MSNFDKDNLSGKNHEGANANRALKFLTASSIVGDKVHNLTGEHLGSIKDIMIDLVNGKIEYVILEMGGFLGMGDKYFAIPFSLLKVDRKSQTFILDQVRETLNAAPGFDKDHWPETNSHIFDGSTAYWGSFMGANTGSVPY
jgi:sporulation protein YlmC with PRC-barrel domain